MKHGHRRSNSATSPTWISWRAMVARCTNAGASDFPRYGGRGVTVCDRWRASFIDFLADLGERPPGMSLDRIDPDGNYEPSNVRWAVNKTQARNKRDTRLLAMGGKTQCLAAWAAEIGIDRTTIRHRLKMGWSIERALSEPLMPRAERGVLGLRARGVICE